MVKGDCRRPALTIFFGGGAKGGQDVRTPFLAEADFRGSGKHLFISNGRRKGGGVTVDNVGKQLKVRGSCSFIVATSLLA